MRARFSLTRTFVAVLLAVVATAGTAAADGTNIEIVSQNISINENGVVIAPYTGSHTYQPTHSFRFDVPTGNNGLSGFDSSGNGRGMQLQSKWTGTGDRINQVTVSAENAPVSGGTADYALLGLYSDGSSASGTLVVQRGSNVSTVGPTSPTTVMIQASVNGTITIDTGSGGRIDFVTATQTTVGAAGGASLPGAPVGYLRIKVSGTDYVIPYFNP